MSKSLEAKYKQLVRATKPTGDADMPEYVYQAHEIKDAINKKAGTHDVDDDDITGEVANTSSDDDNDTPAKLVLSGLGLGSKAQAWAWLSLAQASRYHRPGPKPQIGLGLAWLGLKPGLSRYF
ncbi:hypothetical protein BJ912DRAFT_1109652 [Pholiota molesta]|nr:hypothetical protein BJ912DRAFT_1109652 [Pholiota molesta]